MDADTCDHQLGAALIQTEPSEEREPLRHFSRTSLSSEKSCFVPGKECLVAVWALQTLRRYLQGERFVIHSNQASLGRFMGIAKPSCRLMQWRLRHCEFTFDIEYKNGNLNNQASAPCRLKYLRRTTVPLDENNLAYPDVFTVAREQAALVFASDVSNYPLLIYNSSQDPLSASATLIKCAAKNNLITSPAICWPGCRKEKIFWSHKTKVESCSVCHTETNRL